MGVRAHLGRLGPLGRALVVLLVLVLLGVLAAEAAWFVTHIDAAWDRLHRARWRWIVIALLAEWGSMVAFARLQRTMIAAGGVRVRLRHAIAVTFAANAMSVTLPGGAVLSSAYLYRKMRGWGASASLVAFGLVVTATLSSIALAIIALLGGTLAGDNLNPIAIGAEVLALIAIGLGARRVITHPDVLLRSGTAVLRFYNRMRKSEPSRGVDWFREFIEELGQTRPRVHHWLRGLAYAAVNWIADLICLVAACRAVGAHGPGLALALVAYGAGVAASSIPILPGGLGVVDGALVLALHTGGIRLATATAGVILYRLISFVLVSLVGWAMWLAIHRRERRVAAIVVADATVGVTAVVAVELDGSDAVAEPGPRQVASG